MHREIRLRLEVREESLSPWGARSRLSRGRERPEAPCPMRTSFQRDRDRILHSKAFRRLTHKTQVFIAPLGDHFVTRLTHTLEVAQIARSICRALNLNEDLAEAIALGHDLGHTPFGHAGEEELDRLFPEGFRHNEQSRRVVEVLENEGRGLNLTWEVRDGILKHSKTRATIQGEEWELPATLEGRACQMADFIAYLNHDLSDALRADLFTLPELPDSARSLGETSSQRINTLVSDVIESSWAAMGQEPGAVPAIIMSPKTREAADALWEFLFQRLYTIPAIRAEAEAGRGVVRFLYKHFVTHPDFPNEYGARPDTVARKAVDYIAGMTDRYAWRLARQLGCPESEAFLRWA